jgi:uncharacterized protein
MEVVMPARRSGKFVFAAVPRRLLAGAAVAAAAIFVAPCAQAQQQPAARPEARVIVVGEGSVHVAPDYAQIRGGVTTKGKTVKEATDANSKVMAAVTAALLNSGIAQTDIQTAQFSIQPVYAPPPQAEPKLVGYSVSNQVTVTVRALGKVSEILDRMVDAGATDIGNVAFLHSDPAKALDQAREAAVADARRKAELYAHAAGFMLGRVAWITEDTGTMPPVPMPMFRAQASMATPVPISAGEDTLRVQITVGFDIAN